MTRKGEKPKVRPAKGRRGSKTTVSRWKEENGFLRRGIPLLGKGRDERKQGSCFTGGNHEFRGGEKTFLSKKGFDTWGIWGLLRSFHLSCNNPEGVEELAVR